MISLDSLLDSSKTIVEVAINNGYNINDITLINESGNIDESKFKKFVKQMSNYDTRVIYKFNEFILTDTIFKMARAGKSVFEIARYASKARNSVRLISQKIMFDAIDQSLIAGTNGWNIEYRTTFINKLIKTDKSFYNELCKRVEKILSTEELSQFKKDGLIDYLKRRLTVNEELRNIVFDFYDSIIDENGNPRDSKLSNIVENIWYSVLEGSVKANNFVDTCFGLVGYQNEYTFAIARMYKYGLNVSDVNQIIELAKKNGVKTNSMSIDDIVSKNISYIQSLMDNGMINSSFDLYDVLRMLITGIPFKDILNFNSITTVEDVQLLLSSNEFKKYIINEVISGNIVISNDYILFEIVNNMDSIQFKNSFNNRVLGQIIIRFIKDGFLDVSSSILDDIVSDINAGFIVKNNMFYDAAVSVFEGIRKKDNALYMKYYKDIVKLYDYLYSFDNTRARLPIPPKVKTDAEFIDIANVLGYDGVKGNKAVNALLDQIRYEVDNKWASFSIDDLDRLFTENPTIAEELFGIKRSDWLSSSFKEKQDIYNSVSVSANYYQLYSNAIESLRLMKVNELNGVYADSDGKLLTAADILILRMKARKGTFDFKNKVTYVDNDVFVRQKTIRSSNGIDYTDVFPKFDDIYSNEHVYSWTRSVLNLTDSQIQDFCKSKGYDYVDNIDALGYYIKNNSPMVKGAIYQDATFGKPNLARFGSVGPLSQIYELNDSKMRVFWPSQIGTDGATIDYSKKYNYSGGVFVLLTNDKTINENFPEYTRLNGGKLEITNMKDFGYYVLAGVPLSSSNGAFRIDVEFPINLCSVPSLNNECMYTAYGAPGGKLASGELETVIPAIDVSNFDGNGLIYIKDINNENDSKFLFDKEFGGKYVVKDYDGTILGIIDFKVTHIKEVK